MVLKVIVVVIKSPAAIIKQPHILKFIINTQIIIVFFSLLSPCFLYFLFGYIKLIEIGIPIVIFIYFFPVIFYIFNIIIVFFILSF